MTKPASREDLYELHTALTDALKHYLATIPPEKRRAEFMHVIRAFLRDNGIAAVSHDAPAGISEGMDELQGLMNLPFKN